MATTIYLIRHGETEAQKQSIVCGSTDSPLTLYGSQRMKVLGQNLKDIPFQALYLSPLVRSSQSAESFLSGYGRHIPYYIVPELREITYGEWEGKPKQKYAEAKSDFFSKNPDQNGLTIGVGGAEPYQKAAERFSQALIRCAQDHDNKNILLINHSGNIRSLVLTETVHMPEEIKKQFQDTDFKYGDMLVLELKDMSLVYRDFRHIG